MVLAPCQPGAYSGGDGAHVVRAEERGNIRPGGVKIRLGPLVFGEDHQQRANPAKVPDEARNGGGARMSSGDPGEKIEAAFVTVTNLMIVEDEPLFAELLRRSLAADPSLDVVCVVDNGENAVARAAELEPDVVLMDIELAGAMDGIDAALRIKATRPDTGVVILSNHNDRRYLSGVPFQESTGWAYLLKQSTRDLETVVRAIDGTKAGMVVLDPAVVLSLRPREGSLIASLSPRQREVLELIAQGYTNAAIAGQLTLTEKSVETYINGIYHALGLSSDRNVHARVKATLLYLEDS